MWVKLHTHTHKSGIPPWQIYIIIHTYFQDLTLWGLCEHL
eukprot:NODE_13574_length_168_cov_13.159664_g13491_i0.p3 GENE.NODE_13574_length_168_cov_13.159664_g13491_i0~~NODE_13574_length_168_cov_13.159664_g13491_i0.p3  ORF type:complete len:50 (-),score=22.45 NODE_13574_length_168_cov_13.159664_g13491_i0:18-137(-)